MGDEMKPCPVTRCRNGCAARWREDDRVDTLYDFGPIDAAQLEGKVQHAMSVLHTYQPEGEYFGAFSGGKDSCVIKELSRMAGVRVKWHYNVTTIDPPELVRFIRKHHPDVVFLRPRYGNFFARAAKKGLPTRRSRWCCAEYKEMTCPRGSVMILGVRAAESPRRAARWKTVSYHTGTRANVISPILDWADREVWLFLKSRGIPYCSLYDEGFKRLGCIGCPMAREKWKRMAFARWPRYEQKWKDTMRAIWERRTGSLQKAGASGKNIGREGEPWFGDAFFHSWEEMWEWWISDNPLPPRLYDDGSEEDSCQLALDMFSGGEDE